jgi:hypothetical protein
LSRERKDNKKEKGRQFSRKRLGESEVVEQKKEKRKQREK